VLVTLPVEQPVGCLDDVIAGRLLRHETVFPTCRHWRSARSFNESDECPTLGQPSEIVKFR